MTSVPKAPKSLDIAYNTLLNPAELEQSDLQSFCDRLIIGDVDHADIYFQLKQNESWSLESGLVKAGSFHIDQGFGIRAMAGAKTGLAYSQTINRLALEQAVHAARQIGSATVKIDSSELMSSSNLYPQLYSPINPLNSMNESEKIHLLKLIDLEARKQDPRIKEVIAHLSGQYEVILVARSDGLIMADVRPMVRLDVRAIAEYQGQREQGYAGGGGRTIFSKFADNNYELVKNYTREAVRLALINLEATPAPAGEMPVVLGSGWPGVLLHEAIGHGLEADFNRKGSSAFTGRLGERVATDSCTVVDDGTLPFRRGSLNMDDEGTQTQYNVLIEKGTLRMYMQDRLNARLMKTQPTGNGRRESYAHIPMPRMTNTYMLPGTHNPEDIIASVEHGIYAVNFAGGQVDITSGKFVFSTSEAYLIEKGKVTRPLKNVTLIGDGPEVLTKVSMVGNDLKLDEGVGICGKQGQSVPVGVGQPTLKVNKLVVGGTA